MGSEEQGFDTKQRSSMAVTQKRDKTIVPVVSRIRIRKAIKAEQQQSWQCHAGQNYLTVLIFIQKSEIEKIG